MAYVFVLKEAVKSVQKMTHRHNHCDNKPAAQMEEQSKTIKRREDSRAKDTSDDGKQNDSPHDQRTMPSVIDVVGIVQHDKTLY